MKRVYVLLQRNSAITNMIYPIMHSEYRKMESNVSGRCLYKTTTLHAYVCLSNHLGTHIL